MNSEPPHEPQPASPPSQPAASKSSRPFSIGGIVVIVGLLLFLLSFHIVAEGGRFAVFPKQSLTFAQTIVDVSQVVDQANSRSLGEKLRGEGTEIGSTRF